MEAYMDTGVSHTPRSILSHYTRSIWRLCRTEEDGMPLFGLVAARCFIANSDP
jgi:hypothetical protein